MKTTKRLILPTSLCLCFLSGFVSGKILFHTNSNRPSGAVIAKFYPKRGVVVVRNDTGDCWMNWIKAYSMGSGIGLEFCLLGSSPNHNNQFEYELSFDHGKGNDNENWFRPDELPKVTAQ